MQKVPGPTLGWKLLLFGKRWRVVYYTDSNVSEEPAGSIFGVETSVYKKVKQSRYRLGVAQRVPGS
jgi:hypothetical protein